MKKILVYLISFSFLLNPTIATHAQASIGYQSLPKINIFEEFRQSKLKIGNTIPLKKLLTLIEARFEIPSKYSVIPFLNKKNSQDLVSYSVQQNKVIFEIDGKIGQVEITENQTFKINGVRFNKEQLQDLPSFMKKAQALLESSTKNKFSLLQFLMNGLLPEAKADIGTWGFVGGMTVLAIGLMTMGYFISQTGKKTKHDVTVHGKIDPVEVNATATGNITGLPKDLPSTINLNLNANPLNANQ